MVGMTMFLRTSAPPLPLPPTPTIIPTHPEPVEGESGNLVAKGPSPLQRSHVPGLDVTDLPGLHPTIPSPLDGEG